MRTKNKRRYYINKKRLTEKRNATKIENIQINYWQEGGEKNAEEL